MRSHLRQPGYSALTQHSRLAEDRQWALSHCSPLPSKLKHSFFTSVPQQTTNCPQSETEISAKPMFSAVSSVKIWPCFVGTLCTSLATLQLWDMKLPWELLWTSGYSGWSLSEKISTSCRRLFHLNSPQVFKACKLFISIFLFSHKTVARKKIPNMSPKRETMSGQFKNQHVWQRTQSWWCTGWALHATPQVTDLTDENDVTSVRKRQSFTTGTKK